MDLCKPSSTSFVYHRRSCAKLRPVTSKALASAAGGGGGGGGASGSVGASLVSVVGGVVKEVGRSVSVFVNVGVVGVNVGVVGVSVGVNGGNVGVNVGVISVGIIVSVRVGSTGGAGGQNSVLPIAHNFHLKVRPLAVLLPETLKPLTLKLEPKRAKEINNNENFIIYLLFNERCEKNS
ncbi:hypothetical protein FF38_00513 [Lucilia cuprina]|uniref:Uncharacterized protein n=1 Tax=Lucilia cuprina TaxID=7375 RepID=A0A0L0CJC9_LUCCU|nr:hypothetical protein FF38_00513 [Lucilia cuprina]